MSNNSRSTATIQGSVFVALLRLLRAVITTSTDLNQRCQLLLLLLLPVWFLY